MKKILFLLLFLSKTVYACEGYVLGFKGTNDIFDQRAFASYAAHVGYCAKSYSWDDTESAKLLISNTTVPYQLYGYSLGVVSVKNILKTNVRKPELVVTIGAYRTTDVNFDSYDVKYKNYFDHSGKGQKGPGIFLDVSHDKIQQAVNKIISIKK